MPRRKILTDRQRSALLDLPTEEASLLRFYTLADDDLEHIHQRRRPENRIGFALQLCALRYPGRLLQPGELVPLQILRFLGAQLGLPEEALLDYARRRQTRYQHSAELQEIYGFRPFEENVRREMVRWIGETAENALSNEDLACRFVKECRHNKIILPAVTTIERLCADALVDAERRIEVRIADRLVPDIRQKLLDLLADTVDGRVTRFVWLRQIEPGNNSADANRLMDKLEYLRAIKLPNDVFLDMPAHRVTRLRRHGERYYADGMRDLPEDRRLAILAVCASEWQIRLADALVETHDRIVGKLYRTAERLCEAKIANEKTAVRQTLKSFAELGESLIGAQDDGQALGDAVTTKLGWDGLRSLVATAARLTDTMATDPLSHVLSGYHRFRRYTPRMLKLLEIHGATVAVPLLNAVRILREGGGKEHPHNFLRAGSKWHRHLRAQPNDDYRLWEVSALFHLRDAFRSGDIWLTQSRRYGDLKQVLVPAQAVANTTRLAIPLRPREWLEDRRTRMENGLKALARAARNGTISGGTIENGVLHVDKLEADVPDGADDMVLDLYKRMPDIKITDLLLEVDSLTGFSEAFTHLRTGAPCSDRIGLMNVVLAEGINLGLRKMADATHTHGFWELMRIARWHVEGEAFNRALAMVVEAHAKLPMAAFWGKGLTASSDGQFFRAAEKGEAMNLINAKYGNEPGLKAYSHVSDQYAPFSTQAIPATASEAPYILDGLLMNETGKRIQEQYADTGGFTDHVFAACSITGFAFIPHIRDLPSKRFYVFDPASAPANLRSLITDKVKEPLIERNWPDILRIAATMTAGIMPPSQILRKLASYPRQNELALALREVGRVERTLFMINWIMDIDMQRRARVGLNKGESHHALKQAVNFYRRGEIRDRSTEGQHYRIAGLNLLTAIIIFWNTLKLGDAVESRNQAGLPIPPELLAHVSPLGWEHINLIGEYRWRVP